MKKPVLYIIHGWTYTVTPWDKTIASLKKQGLDVQMLHVPGLTAPSKKVWTIEEYVKWADRNIPDGAVALGHSNGGRILLNLCSEKPQKLQHLILLDSAGVYEPSGKRDVVRSLSKTFGFLKKIPGLKKLWHKITGASDYDRAPENMKKTLSNMLESDKKLDLTKITIPTSILWGASDNVTPPHQAKIMHEQIKNSTLDMHQGWTHAPYISHPVDLAKAIFRAYKKPPQIKPKVEVTQAAEVSASMALKKAAEPAVPDTAGLSASMAFKKASGPVADNISKSSASLSVVSSKKAKHDSIVEGLKGVNYEQSTPDIPTRQTISTSSVPKISRLEKMKRAAQRKSNAKKINQTKRRTAKQTAKATKVQSKIQAKAQAQSRVQPKPQANPQSQPRPQSQINPQSKSQAKTPTKAKNS